MRSVHLAITFRLSRHASAGGPYKALHQETGWDPQLLKAAHGAPTRREEDEQQAFHFGGNNDAAVCGRGKSFTCGETWPFEARVAVFCLCKIHTSIFIQLIMNRLVSSGGNKQFANKFYVNVLAGSPFFKGIWWS